MVAPPMRRWQNLLALLAVVLAAGALLPLGERIRYGCMAAAIGLILLILMTRLRAHRPAARRPSGPDVYDRIAKIRAEREKRTRR
jgi:hypothetical protein